MEYLTETHSHTADVSVCAKSSAEELVSLYKEAGYSTVVLTNHMNGSAFSRPGITDWQKKIDHLMRGYDKAYKLAGNDLNLLFGFEINFYGYCNDYLVYGATEEMLRNNGDLMAMPVTEFSSLARSSGCLFIQAHPFRPDTIIIRPEYCDGYEVFNGNPRHNSSNDIAAAWADKYGKIKTSGSDYHITTDVGIGGIYFNTPITTVEELIKELKKGDYRLKTE